MGNTITRQRKKTLKDRVVDLGITYAQAEAQPGGSDYFGTSNNNTQAQSQTQSQSQNQDQSQSQTQSQSQSQPQPPDDCVPCVLDVLYGQEIPDMPDPDDQPKQESRKTKLDKFQEEARELLKLKGNELVIYKQAKTIKTGLDQDPKIKTIYDQERQFNTHVTSFLKLFVGFWKKAEYDDVKVFGVVLLPGEYVYICKFLLGVLLLFTLIPFMIVFIVPFSLGLIKSDVKQVILICVALIVIFLLQWLVLSEQSAIVIEMRPKQ
jgi:hypothetical protein